MVYLKSTANGKFLFNLVKSLSIKTLVTKRFEFGLVKEREFFYPMYYNKSNWAQQVPDLHFSMVLPPFQHSTPFLKL